VPGESPPSRRLPFELCDACEGLVVRRIDPALASLENAPRAGDLLHAGCERALAAAIDRSRWQGEARVGYPMGWGEEQAGYL